VDGIEERLRSTAVGSVVSFQRVVVRVHHAPGDRPYDRTLPIDGRDSSVRLVLAHE
jgi:hypothetical protein